MTSTIERLDAFTMPTYRRWPVEIVSGTGCRLVDRDGREYVDLVAGIAVAGVGHCHPRVVKAIADQAGRLIHVSNLYPTGPQALLAERLAELTGGMQAFFANSGAESIECALKLARKWARRERGATASTIIAAHGGFHGRTYGALAATGQPAKQAPFEPLPKGFVHVPFGDEGALRAAVDEDTAAILLEPIQGEAGLILPPDSYLRAARDVCDENGILLILDEVQTGLGRTGAMFAYEHSELKPDVLCLGKALAGGLPMSVALARPDVASAFEPGDHGSTFGGGPVPAAAALAVLDVIEDEKLVANAASMGEVLRKGIEQIAPPDAEVRGMGLLIGLELSDSGAREFASSALDAGVLVNNTTDRVVRLTPPLIIGRSDIDEALGRLEGIL